MPRYEGYHESNQLPFRQGQKVVIPAGVTVKTTNPSKDDYVLARRQTVEIKMFMPGRSVSMHYAMGEAWIVRKFREERGIDLDAVGRKLLEEDRDQFYNGRIHLDNPKVCWAGTSGYWCEVDINDILEANGIVDEKVAA